MHEATIVPTAAAAAATITTRASTSPVSQK